MLKKSVKQQSLHFIHTHQFNPKTLKASGWSQRF